MIPANVITSREAAYVAIRRLVARRSAIVLDPTKDYLIDARLAPIVEEEGYASLEELANVLELSATTRLIEAVVEAMTTNESYFFRDTAVFRSLENEILPDLIRRRAATKRLRIWSAACSSGQEPYSLAILLDRRLPDLASWDVKIIASDISPQMVERTREGLYSGLDVRRGVSPRDLTRYFVREGTHLRVVERLRRIIEPRRINLIDPWDVERCDLLLIRNVLIYFDLTSRKRVIEKCARVLAHDGTLMMGAQETLLGVTDRLEHVTLRSASAYRLKSSF